MTEFEVLPQKQTAVRVNVYAKRSEPVWIMLASDMHLDSPHCDYKLVRRQLKKLKERKGLLLLGGDTFDIMTGRNDPRRTAGLYANFDPRDDVTDQALKIAYSELKDVAPQVVAVGQGNHEATALKNLGTDLCWRLISKLQTDGGAKRIGHLGYSNYIIFHFIQKGASKSPMARLVVWYHHGYGGNAKRSKGVLEVDLLAADYPDAQIYWLGHIHQGWDMPKKVERLSRYGNVRGEIKTVCQTPSYKFRDGWNVQKGHGPQVRGCIWIKAHFEDSKIVYQTIRDFV